MSRQLKVWNGRGYCCYKLDDPRWASFNHPTRVHACVCAHSRADAARVIESYTGHKVTDAELRDYWAECWGNSMKGITPERGLWLEFEAGKPTRVA